MITSTAIDEMKSRDCRSGDNPIVITESAQQSFAADWGLWIDVATLDVSARNQAGNILLFTALLREDYYKELTETFQKKVLGA